MCPPLFLGVAVIIAVKPQRRSPLTNHRGAFSDRKRVVELRRLELLTPCLQSKKALNSYLNSLKIRNCSNKYIGANKRFLLTLANTYPIINQETALHYLGTFNNIGANSRARYGGMLKGFLNHMGMTFDTKFKRPKLLPQRVLHEDVEKLKEAIKNKQTHKQSAFRDLVLVGDCH